MVGTLARTSCLSISGNKSRVCKATSKDFLPWGVPLAATYATMPSAPNARRHWGEGSPLQPIVSQERATVSGKIQSNDRNRKSRANQSRHMRIHRCRSHLVSRKTPPKSRNSPGDEEKRCRSKEPLTPHSRGEGRVCHASSGGGIQTKNRSNRSFARQTWFYS